MYILLSIINVVLKLHNLQFSIHFLKVIIHLTNNLNNQIMIKLFLSLINKISEEEVVSVIYLYFQETIFIKYLELRSSTGFFLSQLLKNIKLVMVMIGHCVMMSLNLSEEFIIKNKKYH